MTMNSTAPSVSDAKIDSQLMRQGISPGVEGIVEGIVKEVSDRRRVDVGQPNESPSEVAGATPCSEHAAKPWVEDRLHTFSAMCIRTRRYGREAHEVHENMSSRVCVCACVYVRVCMCMLCECSFP